MVWVVAVSSVPAQRSKVPGSMDQWWVAGLQKPRSLVLRVKVDGAGFVGLEGDAEEAFELADGAAGAAGALVGVELNDFIAGAGAGVLDVDGDLQGGAGVDGGCRRCEGWSW